MKTEMMKRALMMLVTAVLLGSCTEKQEVKSKAPIRVTTEVVSAAAGHDGQCYVGIVEEREATAVSFTGMGVVKRVLVSEGQAVSRGQLIAEMDGTQARNALSAAEAQMTQADDALQRYGMLHDNGSLPEVKWVEIQSKVAQAKAQLDMARKNVADTRLTAPVSGIIGKKFLGAGETAMPSQSVVSILDISSVKVKVAVPEAEIGGIETHSATEIKVEAIGGTFNGGMIEKGVVADALTHTYDIRINVANSNRRLLPGMVASVRFTEASPLAAGHLSLPVTAVQKKVDGSFFVWTVDDNNQAHRTTVTTGQTIGNRLTITSGLESGQRVVTEGYLKLSEGTQVVF